MRIDAYPAILFAFLLAVFPLLSGHFAHAQDIDVLHYAIHIDTINKSPGNERIRAHTEVTFQPLVSNLGQFSLDLLQLTVDSIRLGSTPLNFSHNDTLLLIDLPSPANPSDTLAVQIWYQGRPVSDPQFGGFYFVSGYVFNVGVGLNANPHNFGRVWFPCKDNFQDRALYDFFIRVDTLQTAVCTGNLQSTLPMPDGTQIWHWKLRDPVPSYLVGMAVAPYQRVLDEYIGQYGDTIPVHLYALPGDTNNMKVQAANLKAGIAAFEARFGRYRWERVGYVMVPLPATASIGAMEHATSVVFPRILLPFGPVYETVWAHEISHAWFGNLATCEEEGEMWLNEGWASWSEAIFTEALYGKEAARDYLRDMHFNVLLLAHVEDGGYQALSAVPHAYTYGRTVYQKGAGAVHTLRGQLGDSVFFRGVRRYLDDHAFAAVNSDSLRISMEMEAGRPLGAFFDGWIHQPGFPDFSIDSVKCFPAGPMTSVQVHIRQRLRGAVNFADSVRIPIRLQDDFGNVTVDTAVVSGASTMANLVFPNCPAAVSLDPDGVLEDATTDDYAMVYGPGNPNLEGTVAILEVDSVQDSAWIRIEHHWVAPDSFKTPVPNVRLSDSRYWRVEGNFPAGFGAACKFQYNGGNQTQGLLDQSWLTLAEDSLRIYHRPSTQYDWTLVPGFVLNAGNPNDRRGEIVVPVVQPGEYALGIYDGPLRLQAAGELALSVFPNPNSGAWQLELPKNGLNHQIRLTDSQGKTIFETETRFETLSMQIPALLQSGIYLLQVQDEQGRRGSIRVAVFK